MKTLLLIAMLAMLAGCDRPSERAAKLEVLQHLKDPSSVQWRSVRSLTTTSGNQTWTVVCGEYNAKTGSAAMPASRILCCTTGSSTWAVMQPRGPCAARDSAVS